MKKEIDFYKAQKGHVDLKTVVLFPYQLAMIDAHLQRSDHMDVIKMWPTATYPTYTGATYREFEILNISY